MSSMEPTKPTTRAVNADRILLWSAILIGVFLRLYRLSYQSIWGDEALTLQVYTAGHNFAELWANIWDRAFHPPLYFLIAHYWYLLGKSEFMLRFPSAVFGIATIPIVYAIASRLFGRRTGGLSAMAVALSPFHVWYSQEARMYSLQMLLAAASTLIFVRAWKSRTAKDIAAYFLISAMGLFTQISSMLLLVSQGFLALGGSTRDWRKHSIWIGAQVLAVLAFVPWGIHFLRENSSMGGTDSIGFQRESSPLHLAYALYTLSVGYSLGPSVSALHYLSPQMAIRHHLPVIGISALVFGVLVVLGLIRAYRANRFGFWVLATGLLIPVGLVGMASFIPGMPLNPRYIIVAIVPYWIILALGAETCLRRPLGWIVPLGALAILGVSLSNHYFQPAYAKQDLRSAVAVVNRHAKPGDIAIISSIEIGGPFIYYLKRPDLPYAGYPPRPGLIDRQKLPSDMSSILAGHKRAWLILGRTWSSDPHGILPRTLSARYPLVERTAYQGVEVRCFSLSRPLSQTQNKRKYAY